jgi:hypothetical protein
VNDVVMRSGIESDHVLAGQPRVGKPQREADLLR